MEKWIQDIWYNYKSEVFFGLGLILLTVLSYWLGTFIPEEVFESYINPIEYICTIAVCFFGAFLLYLHSEHNIIRRSWATVLLVWGCVDVLACFMRYHWHIMAIGSMPSYPLFNASVTLGNILAFLFFIYPTQVLRPGWLNWWRALLMLLPMIIMGVVDYFVPANLLHLIMIYPVIIIILLCQHIRKYRQWCEDNFSSMEDIDAQWIVRYLTMLSIVGISFYFIVYCYLPNRMFTQQWMFLLIFSYTTERVLYRPDPWTKVRGIAEEEQEEVSPTNAVYRATLEEWLYKEKPFLNPDFQLMDLRQVLPLNRTYLSQLINAEYGGSFYTWVSTLRIEEAKRMMIEQPELKMQDIAERCGFSSRTVFSRIFTRETGVSPSRWIEKETLRKKMPPKSDSA